MGTEMQPLGPDVDSLALRFTGAPGEDHSVEQFVALRAALQQEKANLEARLAEMTKALGASGAATPVVTTAPGKRHFSTSDQGEDGCGTAGTVGQTQR